MMETMGRDFRLATRTLLRSPGFTLAVVATLALGIGANVAMFGTINAAFFRPLPFPEPDRLVLGLTTFGGNINPTGSSQDYYDYREGAASYDGLSAFLPFPIGQAVTGGDLPEMITTQYVDWDYFRTLGVTPVLGRDFNAAEAEDNGDDVALLSHGYWQRRFGGDAGVVGRVISVSGTPTTVIGVMPASFHLLLDTEMWLPMRPNGRFAGLRRFHNWLMVGRLAPGVDLSTAQSEADLIYRQLEQAYPDSNTDKGLSVRPLRESLLLQAGNGLLLLWGSIGMVLLIACGNVAGLLLARSSSRKSELAVRVALGASRTRLARGLFAESLLLAAGGGALGLALAGVFSRLIGRFMPLNIPGGDAVGLSPEVVAFALVLTLATGVLFGGLPALKSSRTDVAHDLRSGSRSSSERESARLRSGLVVAQVALSVVLLVGSGLLIRSFARITGIDPGFDPANVLTGDVRLPDGEYSADGSRTAFFEELTERVRAMPGVTASAMISALPVANPGNNVGAWSVERPPADPSQVSLAYQRIVLPGYFETMGIPLVAGRDLSREDTDQAPDVIVLNATMAGRLFPDESALGRLVAVDTGGDEARTFEVAGVVADSRVNSLGSDPEPAMYFSHAQRPTGLMRLVVRSSSAPGALAAPIRQALREQDPDIPFASVATMDDVLSGSVSNFRVMATALSLFAGAAMLLAAMGLYGVLSLYVTRRRHEIGVRVALGADTGRVVGGVVRRGLKLVVVGLAVGVVAALASTRLIGQLLFGVEATDPATFVGVGVFFLAVATAASLVPGWRAARVDPVVAFRAE